MIKSAFLTDSDDISWIKRRKASNKRSSLWACPRQPTNLKHVYFAAPYKGISPPATSLAPLHGLFPVLTAFNTLIPVKKAWKAACGSAAPQHAFFG